MEAKIEEVSLCSFYIAGVQHYDYDYWYDPYVGAELKIKREPENPFDPNALAIWTNKYKIGFVPRKTFQTILLKTRKKFPDTPIKLKLIEYNPQAHTAKMFKVEAILCKTPQAL